MAAFVVLKSFTVAIALALVAVVATVGVVAIVANNRCVLDTVNAVVGVVATVANNRFVLVIVVAVVATVGVAMTAKRDCFVILFFFVLFFAVDLCVLLLFVKASFDNSAVDDCANQLLGLMPSPSRCLSAVN